MKPIRIDDDGVPLFSNLDIDDYGFPELYGYHIYRVIESRESNFVTDYKQEHQYDLRPVHRYSRLARFKQTLYNLLGERGKVPQHVFDMCRIYMNHSNPDKWNACRTILKCFKQRQYYNCIPLILRKLCGKRCFKSLTGQELENIINDFKALSEKFDRLKPNYQLRYFPNIRFVCLKLLEMHGHQNTYPIPLLRTDRKRKSLNALWEDLLL
jgi:hypothetical protein